MYFFIANNILINIASSTYAVLHISNASFPHIILLLYCYIVLFKYCWYLC